MQKVKDIITEMENQLIILKELDKHYGDLIISPAHLNNIISKGGVQKANFNTKENSQFDNWEFSESYESLKVVFFKEVKVIDPVTKKSNKIKVNMRPGKLLILRVGYNKWSKKHIILFTQFSKDFAKLKLNLNLKFA